MIPGKELGKGIRGEFFFLTGDFFFTFFTFYYQCLLQYRVCTAYH